jgi:negative regulator of sigma E activity
VVRDCLRNQDGGFAREGLCARVNHVLEHENLQATSRGTASRWLKPVAGMAIAASVALMAVMAVDPGTSPALQSPGGVAESGSVESFTSPQGLSQIPVSSQAVSSQRMDSYLLRHYQAAGSSGGRSFVALVPVMVKSQASASEQAVDTDSEDNAEDTINTPDTQ